MSIQLSGPLLRNVFPFLELRPYCSMDVVTHFVKQNMTEDYVPQEWHSNGNVTKTAKYLVYPQFDIRRSCATVIASCDVSSVELAFPRPGASPTVPARQRCFVRQDDTV